MRSALFVPVTLDVSDADATVARVAELEDATERVGPAIVRRARDFTFPWQMSLFTWLGMALPRPLYRLLVSRT